MSTKKSFFAHLVEKVDPDKPSGKGTPVNRLPLRGVSAPLETIETEFDTEALHTSKPLGYGEGAGSYTTVATLDVTVTINKLSGKISISNFSIAPGEIKYIQVEDSFVGDHDVVVVSKSGSFSNQKVVVDTKAANGTFLVYFHNYSTADTYTSALYSVNFAIIKSASY
jgi:hypothetical protein